MNNNEEIFVTGLTTDQDNIEEIAAETTISMIKSKVVSTLEEMKAMKVINNLTEQFGCKEIPNIHLYLKKDNQIQHDFYLDTLIYYHYNFDSNCYSLYFTTVLINPHILSIISKREYDKISIIADTIWRSAEDGEDKTIDLDLGDFDYIRLDYSLVAEGEPTKWEFCLRRNYNE